MVPTVSRAIGLALVAAAVLGVAAASPAVVGSGSGAAAAPALRGVQLTPLPTQWYNCSAGDCSGKTVAPTTLARHIVSCGTMACNNLQFDCSGAPAGSICEMRCNGMQSCGLREIRLPNGWAWRSAYLTCPPHPGVGSETSCVADCSGFSSCPQLQLNDCNRGMCAATCSGPQSCPMLTFNEACRTAHNCESHCTGPSSCTPCNGC